ncbi:hypothetical protein GIB67_027739 [Kingdonia uniflora]|uniref:GAG-pre-integrase domain-containing protein n=1 Tax=Kingdonia uniflora TaxID=39325 RepID=A0A7J7PBZ1_9MAGN|nr:hypothetical protein GIB67_027739 [Kingdonia uniflora]
MEVTTSPCGQLALTQNWENKRMVKPYLASAEQVISTPDPKGRFRMHSTYAVVRRSISVYKALYKSFGGFAADVVAAIDQKCVTSVSNSRKRVTFSDVVEVFGDDSCVIPFGSSLLTSGDYSDVEVKGKRVSHIENGSKKLIKAWNCSKVKIPIVPPIIISNDLCDMTCDIRDKPCNVIHGTRDKLCWLSYGVCKRSRLDLDAPLEIASDKSELSSYDECYHIVDNGDVRIVLTNYHSFSSDTVQYVSSMARNMFSSQLSDLGLLATFGNDAFEIMKEAITLVWDKRQDAYLEMCNANDEIIGVVTSMVDSRVWHEKLGHVSIWMKALFSRRILDKLKSIDLFFCEDIVLVKQKKVRVSSNGGLHVFDVFIGDSTQELGVHFLNNETDWLDVFPRWKAWVEIETGLMLKCLGSNGDGDQLVMSLL